MISQTVGELEGRGESRVDERGGAKSLDIDGAKSTRVSEREQGCVVGVEKTIRIENSINIDD